MDLYDLIQNQFFADMLLAFPEMWLLPAKKMFPKSFRERGQVTLKNTRGRSTIDKWFKIVEELFGTDLQQSYSAVTSKKCKYHRFIDRVSYYIHLKSHLDSMLNTFSPTTQLVIHHNFVLNLQSRDWGFSGGLLVFSSELAKGG